AVVEENRQRLSQVLDLAAGILGLRFHRQFVLELLNENPVALLGAEDFSISLVGPWVENLNDIALNSQRQQALAALLPAVGNADEADRARASVALGWLLRAWAERDPVSRSVARFIPLET